MQFIQGYFLIGFLFVVFIEHVTTLNDEDKSIFEGWSERIIFIILWPFLLSKMMYEFFKSE